jgi:Uma2 family endonuclease
MATPDSHPTLSEPDRLSPVRHRRFSVAEYHRMIDMGILNEDEHVELLEGEIVQMPPMEKPHARATTKLDRRLQRALSDHYVVRVQMPLTLRDSEPEPDVAVVLAKDEDTAPRHPSRALLVVEVADSSVRYDLAIKSRIYAKAGIPEYWLVVVRKKAVEVLRDPDPRKGVYRTRQTVGRSGRVTPLAFPRIGISVRSLFD